MIPKIIHYCWLSNDPIPEQYLNCMKSWRQNLPDYEFILWNLERFNIEDSIWVKQAFYKKKYAFAADFIRLYAVFNFGGIYIDMDIEIVKPFDILLNNNIILSYENQYSKNIEAGFFGAEKGNAFIKKCLDYYNKREFSEPILIMPEIMKSILQESFLNENIHVYSHDYFTAKDTRTGIIKITNNTFAIHHFAANWKSKSDKNNIKIMWKITRIFGDNIFSRTIYHSVFKFKNIINRIRINGLSTSIKYYYKKYHIK
ncbi:glycosyltransferase family 32 protein [Leadbettera azotonutricia]|uniref:Glycosyltransferase n=1 Tax=Leadbettera azotonutricia (strain ATCC BAA-888 / DSM 13862 / ZAS-9) TaxID=545695 RepID=F5YAV7_LEAAZ|nr:glycosyltransferase [Leadbettera azotonutricia]AEF80856.1 glycosyltransferase [Leadbettera azotonutricia ZAS-9]